MVDSLTPNITRDDLFAYLKGIEGELIARIDGIEKMLSSRLEGLEKTMFERDRRWSDLAKSTEAAINVSMSSQQRATDIAILAQQRATDAALSAQEKATASAFLASELAVAKAEQANAEWRRGANEWRGAMSDRDKALIGRPEFAAETMRLGDRIDGTALSVAASLANHKADIATLREILSKTDGKSKGVTATVAIGIAIASILLSLITVVHDLTR